jgi:Fe-S cluster assembly protein SufD
MAEATEETKGYLADFGALEKTPAAKRSWIHGLRTQAIERFAALGFPTIRNEEWRYTNVSPIARGCFSPATYRADGLTAADLAGYTFGETDCQLVFINGVYVEGLSAIPQLPRGMRVRNLQSALKTDREKIEPYLGRCAAPEAGAGAFAALNTAFLRDGAFVYIPAGQSAKSVVHLLFLSTAAQRTVAHPRTLIVVGDGSRLSVVETHAGLAEGVYFTNAVTEIVAGAGSAVDHCKIQRESETAYHIGSIHVAQERESTFNSNSISLGGALVRNDIDVSLNSEGGDCTLNGLYVTRGRQHVDNRTRIVHARPHCTSRELYKGILDNSSSGVFNGGIVVRKDAQKTNARQANKNLLLSEDALVNTRPQLEIFADDVKCTHGATIGQLNQEELFYLRSRGIGEESARTLLTYAFASEIVGGIRVKPIQCQIDLVLLNRLTHKGAEVPDIGIDAELAGSV